MTNKPDKKTRLLKFEATIENIKTIEDLKIAAQTLLKIATEENEKKEELSPKVNLEIATEENEKKEELSPKVNLEKENDISEQHHLELGKKIDALLEEIRSLRRQNNPDER